jgi:hypothetical protein
MSPQILKTKEACLGKNISEKDDKVGVPFIFNENCHLWTLPLSAKDSSVYLRNC